MVARQAAATDAGTLEGQSADAVAGPDSEPPQRLGRYTLVRRCAQGAIGELFLASDPATGLPLALKTVRLAGQGPQARERFLREAAAAGRLRHPAIVATQAAGIDGEADQALGWIAMEWVPGHDLGHYLSPSRRLPGAVVLALAARVADGLAHAHQAGIVHRDIKPANILLHLDSGVVKITDFGCAYMSDAERSRSGLLLGSPAYMAPEQLLGVEVDGRCDIYALGAVLYALLAGRPPLQGGSLGELVELIAQREPPRLSTLRPELPPLLSDVLARALAKRPRDRHENAAQLARELRVIARSLGQPAAGRASAQSGHNGRLTVPPT